MDGELRESLKKAACACPVPIFLNFFSPFLSQRKNFPLHNVRAEAGENLSWPGVGGGGGGAILPVFFPY